MKIKPDYTGVTRTIFIPWKQKRIDWFNKRFDIQTYLSGRFSSRIGTGHCIAACGGHYMGYVFNI